MRRYPSDTINLGRCSSASCLCWDNASVAMVQTGNETELHDHVAARANMKDDVINNCALIINLLFAMQAPVHRPIYVHAASAALLAVRD